MLRDRLTRTPGNEPGNAGGNPALPTVRGIGKSGNPLALGARESRFESEYPDFLTSKYEPWWTNWLSRYPFKVEIASSNLVQGIEGNREKYRQSHHVGAWIEIV